MSKIPSRSQLLKSAAAAAGVALVCALLVSTIHYSGPYRVEAATLSGWRLVAGDPSGPALVVLQPPKQLTGELFKQAVQHSSTAALVAPAEPSVPLVLRDEYSDSLQGVMSLEDILQLARDAGVESARFDPVCVIERHDSAAGGSRALVMAVFDSTSFDRFRLQLSPLFPEHAGAAPFDPNAVRPILPIATTDGSLRQLPSVEPRTQCSDQLVAE